MQRIQTLGAVVAATAFLRAYGLAAVSTLKTIVDHSKIHPIHTTPMDKPFEAPSGRLLPTLVIFIFVLGVLYTLFLVFQQVSLNGSIKSIESQKADLETKIAELESQQIQELFVAQQLVDHIEDSAVAWSDVVRSLQDLTPVTVFITSYSAGGSGVQISALGDSFGSVADIITSLEKAPNFEDIFVPSVTAGTTADGQSVVTFSLTADYIQD
jgi:Tfp pilus assembly protein PilN